VLVIHSNRTNVYENLAAEDALLDDISLTEPVVFIYRNDDAVVIGKNQVPWRECAVGKLDGMGIQLARRVSGGGTVFHDAGNLNISCILPRERYCRDTVLNTYITGLNRAGVNAVLTGSTSLTVNGKKISGNAFCYRRDKVLHHGTLLWKANLDKLRAALVPELSNVTTRAVASVPMPVINLSEFFRDNNSDDLINAVIHALAEKWGSISLHAVDPFKLPGFSERLERLKSWDWKFGATPDFECRIGDSTIAIHRGRVQDVQGAPSKFENGQPFSLPG